MADAVRSQVIADGAKNYIVHLTNVSDGTGESNVIKVDISTMFIPFSCAFPRLILLKYDASTFNMGVVVSWEATENVPVILFPPSYHDSQDYTEIGGIPNNAGDGKTGNIVLSTLGIDGTSSTINGSRYDVTLWLRKHYV
jgi:hypothetical protein